MRDIMYLFIYILQEKLSQLMEAVDLQDNVRVFETRGPEKGNDNLKEEVEKNTTRSAEEDYNSNIHELTRHKQPVKLLSQKWIKLRMPNKHQENVNHPRREEIKA